MAAQDGSQLGPACRPRPHQFTIQDRARRQAAENFQFGVAAAIVRPLPAPHRPLLRPAGGQGPYPVPFHLKEVLRGIERRGGNGEHWQRALIYGSLRTEGFFRARPRGAAAGDGGCPSRAAATLCCKASIRGSTDTFASTTGVKARPWRVASTRAAN